MKTSYNVPVVVGMTKAEFIEQNSHMTTKVASEEYDKVIELHKVKTEKVKNKEVVLK